MNAPKTALQAELTTDRSALHVSFELSDRKWRLCCGDGRRRSSFTVAAGDTGAVLECMAKARTRLGLAEHCKVYSCYEAGRDGWWLHRWLRECGIDNIVVDSASIEVNRRARRAKTDRLDDEKLLAMLLRWRAGERGVWAVLREPSVQDEDARRVHRELQRLTKERTAHTNRIGSLLVLHNLRAPGHIGGRGWASWWSSHCEQVPPLLRGEIEREGERLELVKRQLLARQATQRQALEQGEQPQVAHLARMRSIGMKSAWLLVREVFGWRHFDNRREVGASLGLTPTPYDSGGSQREQGISKTGNKRARSLFVELAWRWTRLQPDSEMTQWFNRRFAGGGKRMRRIGIVALARRLAVALWRYLERGEIPAGATLKPAL